MICKQYNKATEDRLDLELRHDLWCKRNRGNYGRDIHITTAISVFKEDIYDIALELAMAGDETLLKIIKNKSKLEFAEKLQKAKDFPIEELVRNLGFEIKQGFTQSPYLPPQRTGSCKIYPNTNSYYCYGVSKGGDTIDFVREIQQCDFATAINFLT